ncbi:hypothetical protein UXN73_03800 [Enterobacter asburiae]|uniref:hypothetical protein n=1 Tax=Enterobacter asburiae TaxID=61645 RepID=UPI002FD17EA7
MRSTFLLAFFTCLPTYAAELSCASFHTSSVQGLSVTGKSGTVIGFSNGITAPNQLTVATQLKVNLPFAWMKEALHGNFLYLERQNRIDGTITLSTPLEITKDRDTTYTITLNCYTSRGDDCSAYNNNWYGYISGSSNGIITQPIINSVPSQSSELSAAVNISLFDGSNTSAIHTGQEKLTFISEEKTTDSIHIPNIIDLGTLSSGYNNHTTSIHYQENTNSIGLKFSQIATNGARLTVNNTMTTTSNTYIPPLTFGLYITGDNPGVYESNVTATWTCP